MGGALNTKSDYILDIDQQGNLGDEYRTPPVKSSTNYNTQFTVKFTLDKTNNTINGKTKHDPLVKQAYKPGEHTVSLYDYPDGYNYVIPTNPICSFKYTITTTPTTTVCQYKVNKSPPTYSPNEQILITGQLNPNYDAGRHEVYMRVFDPKNHMMFDGCVFESAGNYKASDRTINQTIGPYSGINGFWKITVYPAITRGRCDIDGTEPLCPSLQFQVPATQELPTPTPTPTPGPVDQNQAGTCKWADKNGNADIQCKSGYEPTTVIDKDGKIVKDSDGNNLCECRPRSTNNTDPNTNITPIIPPCGAVDDKNAKCPTALGAMDVSSPTKFVGFIFSFILGSLGGIALIMLLYSGFILMTSGGDKEKIQGARDTIISVITGLLFIIFSVAILRFIGVDVLGLPDWF